MVNYREIIKLKSENFSNAAIAVNVGSSRNTVAAVIKLAETHELSWPLPEDLSNHKIERMFYPERGNNEGYKLPDFEYIHNELAKPGVTLSELQRKRSEQDGMVQRK